MESKDDALAAVEQLFDNYKKNYEFLLRHEEISFATDYKNQFAKVILLACASYFETKVIATVLDSLNTKNCSLTYNFISRKALKRQYHTLFNWKQPSANTFFSLFGDEFKTFALEKIKNDNELSISIQDFLLLGHLRNQLVHNNYALFFLELTVEDIQVKFKSAKIFIVSIKSIMDEFRKAGKSK